MACQGCDNPVCDGRFCRGRYKPEFLAAITDDHIDLVAALTEHLAAAASDEDLAALVAAVASADDDRADDGGTGRSGGSDTPEPPPEIGTGRRRLGKGRGKGVVKPLTEHRSSVVLPKPCPIFPNMPAGAPWVITEEIKNLMQLGTSETTARDGASKAEISAGPTTARDGASKAGVTRLLAMQHSTNFSSPTTGCWRCPTATGDVVKNLMHNGIPAAAQPIEDLGAASLGNGIPAAAQPTEDHGATSSSVGPPAAAPPVFDYKGRPIAAMPICNLSLDKMTADPMHLIQLGKEIENLRTTTRDGASKAAIAAGRTAARDDASKARVAAASAASPTATRDVVSTEVAVPWESSPSTWMLPSQNGVLDAFLDSLPATGTVAVDRMPESSAETAADIDEGSGSTQKWLDEVDDTATRMRRRRAAFLRADLQAATEEATKAAASATQAVDALTAAVIALNALVIAASASS